MNLEQLQIELNEVSPVVASLKITIPHEVVSEEVKRKLDDTAKKAKIKGFRPGKAPREMIEKMYGQTVQFEVLNGSAEKALSLAIQDKKLDVVSVRKVDFHHSDLDKGVSYTAELALYPKPEVSDLPKTELTVKEVEVKDEDVDTTLQRLQENFAEFVPPAFREESKDGDLLDVALSIYEEGQEAEGTPERAPVRLGEGRLPKEVETALVGLKVGDSREVKVPAADKTYIYKVTVEGIKEPKLRELNDEFAQVVNPELKTLVDLRMDARKYLEDEAKRINSNLEDEELAKFLIDSFSFEIPEEMIEEEVKMNLVQARIIKEKDPLPPLGEDIKNKLFKEAEGRIKAAILVGAFTKHLGVKVEDSDIKEHLSKLANGDDLRVAEFEKIMAENPGTARELIATLIQQKTVSKIKETVTFKKETVSFYEYTKAKEAEQAAEVSPA